MVSLVINQILSSNVWQSFYQNLILIPVESFGKASGYILEAEGKNLRFRQNQKLCQTGVNYEKLAFDTNRSVGKASGRILEAEGKISKRLTESKALPIGVNCKKTCKMCNALRLISLLLALVQNGR